MSLCVLVTTIPRVNAKMTQKPCKHCRCLQALRIIFAQLENNILSLNNLSVNSITHLDRFGACQSQFMKDDFLLSVLSANLTRTWKNAVIIDLQSLGTVHHAPLWPFFLGGGGVCAFSKHQIHIKSIPFE